MYKIKKTLRLNAFRNHRDLGDLKTSGPFGDPMTVFALFLISFAVSAVLAFMTIIPVLPFVVFTVILAILLIAYVLQQDALWYKHHVKVLQRFAKDNDLEFSKNEFYYSDGIIFNFGNNDHKNGWMFRGNIRGYPIAMYWHFFSSGQGSGRYDYRYAVVEIDLPKSLPHVFLGNQNNNTRFSNKEELDVFSKEHLLELEGDFPRYFKVYADKKQASYVLTILNPGFMKALINNNASYDLEFVGKKAFLYFPRRWAPNAKEMKSLWEGADFIAMQLKKQLDTYGAAKDTAKLRTSITKITFKGW